MLRLLNLFQFISPQIAVGAYESLLKRNFSFFNFQIVRFFSVEPFWKR